jgi:hypothetical protein
VRLKLLIRKTQPYSEKIAHRAFGSNLRSWLRSNIERSSRRAKCGIRFSEGCGRTYKATRQEYMPARAVSLIKKLWMQKERSNSWL